MPYSIAIEPSNFCQLHCVECPTGNQTAKRTKGNVQFNDFQYIIDKYASFLFNLTLYFQGEPFLNTETCRCIKYAVDNHIFVNTSTNGQNIDSVLAEQIVLSGLQQIIISMDGNSQENYEKYRKNGDFEKVKTSILNLAKAKKHFNSALPKIIVQCLLLSSTENNLHEIKQLSKSLGADKVIFKTAQFYNFENGKDLFPKTEKYSRYKLLENGKYEKKHKKMSKKCWRAWSSVVITWDLEVLPCCFDKDGQYSFGNVKEKSLQEIFQSKKYLAFQQQLQKKNKPFSMCHNCEK